MGNPSKSEKTVSPYHDIWTNAAIAALPTPTHDWMRPDPVTPGLVLITESNGAKYLQFTYPGGIPGLIELTATFKVIDVDAARAYANKHNLAYANRCKREARAEWTDSTVANLPPHPKGLPSRYYEIKDSTVPGLSVRVTTAGRKFFYFRETYGRDTWTDRLGEFGQMSVAAVRRRVHELNIFMAS